MAMLLSTRILANVGADPNKLAVKDANSELTYFQLVDRAIAAGAAIKANGVTRGDAVGVWLENSVEYVVAILACLLFGFVFVPLPVTDTQERLRKKVVSSKMVLCITSASQSVGSPLQDGCAILTADELMTAPRATLADVEGPAKRTGREIAYCVYTSGSTGTARGVMVRGESIVNFGESTIKTFGMNDSTRALCVLPFHFDGSFETLFPVLFAGGTLVVTPGAPMLPRQCIELLLKEKITHISFIPSMLNLLVNSSDGDRLAQSSLCTVGLGGEDLSKEDIVRLKALVPNVRVFNRYGPTEATVTVSSCEATNDLLASSSKIPIGVPGPGVTFHLVDTEGKVINGDLTPGELCIGGIQLMEGYCGDPETTKSVMRSDFVPGEVIYKTGDIVHRNAKGEYVYLDRLDDVVKRDGARISLTEISAALRKIAGVNDAVCTAHVRGARTLINAYVSANGITASKLRNELLLHLPLYMNPDQLIFLASLPRLPNGKLDRQALPSGERADQRGSHRPPRDSDEELICRLFAEFIGISAVSFDDNFFHLGGHSLVAMRILARLSQETGSELTLRILFDNPTPELLAKALAVATQYRAPSLRRGIGAQPDGRIALSSGQQRLWALHKLENQNDAYNVPIVLRLRGQVDANALAAAFADLVIQHDPLRTIVESSDGVPLGRLLPKPEANSLLRRQNISNLQECYRDTELASCLAEETARPFNLACDYSLRCRLICLGRDDHVLICVLHHAAADGTSLPILARDLATAYGARKRGSPPNFLSLPVHYADYAAWHRSWLENGTLLADQLFHWRAHLTDAPELLALPTDHPRTADRTREAARYPLRLDPSIVQRLAAIARAHDATLFAVLLAGYAAVLGRLARQADVIIGTPAAGRSRPELENLVGFFVNTLALRLDLSDKPDSVTLITRARNRLLEALANQDIPFERIVEELNLPRRLTHAPLLQVMLTWQAQAVPGFSLSGLAVEQLPFASTHVKFDLILDLALQSDGSIAGSLEYDASLFKETTIARWAVYLIRTFDGIAGSFNLGSALCRTPVTALPILDVEERRLLLKSFNETAAPSPATTLPALFEAQVARTPRAIALVFGDEKLTYCELNTRANRLAHHLIAMHIGPEMLVGIALERSIQMVVALVAVLKAGGAYLPLEVQYPTERLQLMLTDCRAKLLLTTSAIAERFTIDCGGRGEANAIPMLFLDDPAVGIDIACRPETNPFDTSRNAILDPTNLAYVIYTSGSTGLPKGVATTHSNVVGLAWRPKYAPLGPGRAVLQLAPIAFDAATFEVWGALLNGARLVLAPAGTLDLENIAQIVSHHNIDTMWLTAGLLRQVIETHPYLIAGLTRLLSGGDVLPVAVLKRVRKEYPKLTIINGYGPTEATTFACTRIVTDQDLEGERIPIGSPIANMRVYILDEFLSPVPLGVSGELYISGIGLARGYFGRPDLTADRFVDCPFEPPGARMYRTGDLARWRTDGALDFLGRVDRQIKIRGFRVEPSEVESALVAVDGIAQALVMLREIAGDAKLIAYLVPRHGATLPAAPTLRATLATRLPNYMIPAAFVTLDSIPLTTNGKIDRKMLPIPKGAESGKAPPSTETEHRLAEIWKRVLGLDEIAKTADFFELGGHSLLALRLLAIVESEFGCRVDLGALFKSPTIESFALVLDNCNERRFDFRPVVRFHPESTHPQVFCINSTGAYHHLGKLLGPRVPLTALQIFDRSCQRDSMPDSIQDIAAEYVKLIRQSQPKGPYNLLGWCAGGILTFEVAQQLAAAQEEVSFLGLVETYSWFRFGWARSMLAEVFLRVQWNVPEWNKVVAREKSLAKFFLERRSMSRIGALVDQLFRKAPAARVTPHGLHAKDYEYWLMANYLAPIAKKYNAKPFPGRIHVFRSTLEPKGLFIDGLMDWGKFSTAGVEIVPIEGDHFSIFRPPGVGQMAQKIATVIAEVAGLE